MNARALPPPRTGAVVLLAVLSLAALAVLVVLGTWQVQRLHWKEDLLATITERRAAEPRSLDEIEARIAATGDVDYWPVRLEGRFRHEGERHFFATHRGQSGYFVHTPLELRDGRFVLVNRGFVPYDRKDAAMRAEGQLAGPVEIVGLARNPVEEKPSFIVPDNDPAGNLFYWKDWAAMVGSSGVGGAEDYPRLFVDADATPVPGGLPVGGVTIVDLPNNHLQYAITWYGLAVALAGVFGYWSWRTFVRPAPPRT